MDSSRLRRRVVALVAAYALALHGLLLAFVTMAPAQVAAPGLLCGHESGGGPGQPDHRDPPCASLCAAIAQAAGGPLPSGAVIATADLHDTGMAAAARSWTPLLRPPDGPHPPRGPPPV
jgi:hypothetical protein